MNTHNQKPLLAWEAPALNDHDRSERWYLVMGLFATLMIVYGLYSGSMLMSISIALCAGLYFLTRNQKHKVHSIAIYEMGVQFDDVLHPWNELKNFWMLSGPGFCELHFSSTKRLQPDLRIQTGTQDPFHVRDVIHQFLEQDPNRREKLLDTIIRICKL